MAHLELFTLPKDSSFSLKLFSESTLSRLEEFAMQKKKTTNNNELTNQRFNKLKTSQKGAENFSHDEV
jgi:hypothetical protein